MRKRIVSSRQVCQSSAGSRLERKWWFGQRCAEIPHPMEYSIRIASKAPDSVVSSLLNNRQAYRDLLGICEGILADGEVNQNEAAYLREWIRRNPDHEKIWPLPDLRTRLDAIFADGIASPEECTELADVLKALIGAKVVHSDARLAGAKMSGPTQLIFDDPAPELAFADREYCVTGTFAFGQRKAVESAITSRGGSTTKAPRSITHYVLVGSFVSPGWANGNYGTKIERALSLRKGGSSVAIIGEEHWKTFLQ